MKMANVFGAIVLINAGSFGDAVATNNYDSTQFVSWSAAVNDSGASCVAFVKKSDTVDCKVPPVLYQIFKGGQSSGIDTILREWDRRNVMMLSLGNFAIALDNSGWAHFVCNGDSGSCVYLTNRSDGIWKKRQSLNRSTSSRGSGLGPYDELFLGRVNAVAVNDQRFDIVTSADYHTYGNWPFSNLWRITGTLNGDSLQDEMIKPPFGEEVQSMIISNRYGRLSMIYWQSEGGGYEGVNIMVSKNYPVIDSFRYLQLARQWGSSFGFVIIDESQGDISVAIGPDRSYMKYFAKHNVHIGADGLSGIAPFLPRRVCIVLGGQGMVFNLRGQAFSNSSIARLPSGAYLSKIKSSAVPASKHLQVQR